MATLQIVLYKSKKYRDGTHPLMLRICVQSKLKYISLRLNLAPKNWSESKSKVINIRNHVEVNHYIKQYLANAEQMLYEMELSKLPYSAEDLKNKIINKGILQGSVFEYINKQNKKLREQEKISSMKINESVSSLLYKFSNNKNLKFSDITPDFLNKFEKWHLNKGNKLNGFAVYMRTLKALINKAISEDIMPAEINPFLKYKIKTQKTIHRALNTEQLKSFFEIALTEGTKLDRARKIWLISFYMMGANITDMAHLKKIVIRKRHIEYIRRKTGKPYIIPVDKELRKLLTFFADQSRTDYIFNFFKSSDAEKQKLEIQQSIKTINKYLNRIGKKMDLNFKLTTYTARHTYATFAESKGIPITVIQQMLGHESMNTTQIYIDSISTDRLDSFHKEVIKF